MLCCCLQGVLQPSNPTTPTSDFTEPDFLSVLYGGPLDRAAANINMVPSSASTALHRRMGHGRDVTEIAVCYILQLVGLRATLTPIIWIYADHQWIQTSPKGPQVAPHLFK